MKRSGMGLAIVVFMMVNVPAVLCGQTRASASDAAKIKQKVAEYGIGHRVTVVLRNGNEYYGALGESGADSFELSEVDLNQKITIAYSGVKKVRSGFGNPNQFNGKRWNPGWHIASALIVVGVTVGLLIAAGTATR